MRDTTVALFDLFLVHGCNDLPDITSLGAPPLSQEVAHEVLSTLEVSNPPSVLEVALPKRLAWELMGRLDIHAATGDILEVAYRSPEIPVGDARSIAERKLAIDRETIYQAYTFEPLQLSHMLTHGAARWWTFLARSPEMLQQGHVPGGVTIQVDKVDGHIWTTQELYLLGREWDRLLYLFHDWRDRSS